MTHEKTRKHTSEASETLEAVLTQLSFDQIRFLIKRQDTATDKAAAEAIDVSPDTVAGWKYKGVPIDQALRLMAFDGVVVAKEILRRNLAKAAAVKVAGLDSDDERIRQGASTEILDRELGKPTQRQEITGSDGGPVAVDNTIIVREYLRDDSS